MRAVQIDLSNLYPYQQCQGSPAKIHCFKGFLGDFCKAGDRTTDGDLREKKTWMDFVCQVFSFSWEFSRRKVPLFCQIELRSPFWAFWGLAAVGPFRFLGGRYLKGPDFGIKPTKEQTTKPGRVSFRSLHGKFRSPGRSLIFFARLRGIRHKAMQAKLT